MGEIARGGVMRWRGERGVLDDDGAVGVAGLAEQGADAIEVAADLDDGDGGRWLRVRRAECRRRSGAGRTFSISLRAASGRRDGGGGGGERGDAGDDRRRGACAATRATRYMAEP